MFGSSAQAKDPSLEQLIALSIIRDSQENSGSKKVTIEIKNEASGTKKENPLKKYPTKIRKSKPKEVTDPGQIEAAADFASEKTGVRKDFIMGMLVVESDLGRNPGKCSYKEVEDGARDSHEKGLLGDVAWETFNERREIIRDLADSLNYDFEKLQVSCNPANYYGTGGALGIPQFMPDTWLEYKERIADIVGKKNPDPWNPIDGVVAMALKLSDVPGVIQHDIYSERNAAKYYLSGTTSYQYNWYANQIIYWSQNYRNVMG